jgi:hypothetical protein
MTYVYILYYLIISALISSILLFTLAISHYLCRKYPNSKFSKWYRDNILSDVDTDID